MAEAPSFSTSIRSMRRERDLVDVDRGAAEPVGGDPAAVEEHEGRGIALAAQVGRGQAVGAALGAGDDVGVGGEIVRRRWRWSAGSISSCSGLLMPLRWSSWLVMICSGSALLFGSCLMRDPVTRISVSGVPVAAGSPVARSASVSESPRRSAWSPAAWSPPRRRLRQGDARDASKPERRTPCPKPKQILNELAHVDIPPSHAVAIK